MGDAETGTVDLVENQDVDPLTGGEPPTDTTGSEPGPEPEPEPTEGAEPPQESKAGKKSGLQERIDELTRLRHEADERAIRAEARAEAVEEFYKGERQNIAPQETPAFKPVTLPRPRIQQFETVEEFEAAEEAWLDARIAAKAADLLPKMSAQMAGREESNRRVRVIQQAAATSPVLLGILQQPSITNLITQAMEDAADGPHLPQIVEYLGTHVDELRRINRLPAVQQVKEVARIEARLTAKPDKKVRSNAPGPGPEVAGSGPRGKSDEDKSVSELSGGWEKERLQKLGVKR